MKKINRITSGLTALFCLILIFKNGSCQDLLFKVDPSYLSKHDIVYKTPAYEGFEGFPLGNGDLGGMVWNNNCGLEVQINKNDLFDQPNEESGSTLRGGARLSIDLGVPAFEWLYLDDFDGRLSLKDAQVVFSTGTPFMKSHIKSWISPVKNVWFFQISTKNLNQPTIKPKIRVSLERWGSRAFPGWYGGFSKNTTIGLSNTQTKIEGKDIVLENVFKGLSFSIACRILGEEANAEIISSNRIELQTDRRIEGHNITVMVSMVTSNESENPTQSAIGLLDSAERQTIEKEKDNHQQWWNDFWNQSFVHIENDYFENIYYLRRYLMASSSRGMYPVVFNGGLWTWNHDVRNWVTPHHWNTQQQYWGLCAQNDCSLLLPYINTYFRLMPQAEKHARLRGAKDAILWSEPHDFFGSMTFWDRNDMLNNFTPASQIAGFFWEYYQFTCDTSFLREKTYPFMKKTAEFYIQKLQWDTLKNQFFIYPSQPYESAEANILLNPVTDRVMIEALFKSCIKAARTLDVDKKKTEQWQNIIDHLWPFPMRDMPGVGTIIELAYYKDGSIYPKQGNGIYPFSPNTSIVFPGNLIGIDDSNDTLFQAVSNIATHHPAWVNAITPIPIVAARLGLGNVVFNMMKNGIRRLQHFPQGLFYNLDHWYTLSLYKDSVKKPDITCQRDYVYDRRTHYPNGLPAKPFIQCGLEPLSIYAATVNEMLLQSNEGKIRIFPAIPDDWVVAFKLRARGAFMVSSERNEDGTIPCILIESLKGNKCSVVNPWLNRNISVWDISGKQEKLKYETVQKNVIVFETQENHQYIIYPGEKYPNDYHHYTIYNACPNNDPKCFYEAILGKTKDF
jgi:hypothetical protein